MDTNFALRIIAGVLLAACASAQAGEGDLDLSFGTGGVAFVSDGIFDSAKPIVQTDGKILNCGSVTLDNGDIAPVVYRLDGTGAPDLSFGTAGQVTIASNQLNAQCYALALQSDGRIIVAFAGISHSDFRDPETQLVRLGTGGAIDADFGDAGIAHVNMEIGDNDQVSGMAIDANDAIVVAGAVTFSFVVERLDADGHVDATFGDGGRRALTFVDPSLSPVAGVCDLLIDAQGRYVIAGSVASTTVPITMFAVGRLLHDGTPDASFGDGGLSPIEIGQLDAFTHAEMLQSDGRIVVVGAAGARDGTSLLPNYDPAAVRVNDDGTLDTTFGTGGITRVPVDLIPGGADGALDGLIRGDGKILLVGIAAASNASGEAIVLQLDGDGAPDLDFAPHGVRLYDINPDAPAVRSFNGVVQSGSGVIVSGYLQIGGFAGETDFVTRLQDVQGGATPPGNGHSGHARPRRPH